MKSITLKKFKEEYFPELTGQQFSKMLGFDNSFINKVLHGTYKCNYKSKRYLELARHIKTNYSLQLISDNEFDIEAEKARKIFASLNMRIKEQDEEIKILKETVLELTSAVRIMSNAKDSIEKAEFVVNKYIYKKEGK